MLKISFDFTDDDNDNRDGGRHDGADADGVEDVFSLGHVPPFDGAFATRSLPLRLGRFEF